MLVVEGLIKRFGGFTAVNKVSFKVDRGEILGLIGPNGSGKSTIFNLLSGTLSATAGSMQFDGAEIAGLAPHRIINSGIGRTFQIPRPFHRLTLFENVALAGYFGQGRYEAISDAPSKLLSRATNMINWFQSETTDEWIAIGVMLILVLLVVSDGGARTDREAGADPWRRRVRFPLAFVTFVAIAFATPFWIKHPFNWWMINQRFLLHAIERVLVQKVERNLPRRRRRGREELHWARDQRQLQVTLPTRAARHGLTP